MTFGVNEAIGLGSGLLGLLKKRRKSGQQVEAERNTFGMGRIADRLEGLAEGYDPEEAVRELLAIAEKSQGRALAHREAELGRRFVSMGGNPSGDTAFRALRRRATDDALNPLGTYAAEKMDEAKRSRLDYFMRALSARSAAAGQGLQSAQFGDSRGNSSAASTAMLIEALKQILKK